MKPKIRFPGWLLSTAKRENNILSYPEDEPPGGQAGWLRSSWKEHKIAIVVVVVALSMILASVLTYAQGKELRPGDPVPDITVSPILNYPSRSLKLSELKGKLVIIDFWDTWCASCIRLLPRLDSLQRVIGDRVVILPVTEQKEAMIAKFLKTNGYLAPFAISTATDDRRLKALFPHNQLPHEVWIGADGRLLGTSAAEYVNADNIRAVLGGRQPAWAEKQDAQPIDTTQRDLCAELLRRSADSSVVFSECLAGYVPGLPLSAGTVRHGSSVTYYYINHPPLHLYALALGSGLPFDPKRRVLETAAPERYTWSKADGYLSEWSARHCVSFAATVPAGVPKAQVMLDLKEKLDLRYGMQGSIGQLPWKCLVLYDTGAEGRKTLSSYPVKAAKLTAQGASLHSITARDLAYLLDKRAELPPVIDESRNKLPFDLELTGWPKDLDAWNQVLRPLGLELRAEQRLLDIFVLAPAGKQTTLSQPQPLKPTL